MRKQTNKPPWHQNTFNVHIAQSTQEEVAPIYQNTHQYAILTPDLYIYTDGSQLEGKVGVGVAGYHQGDIIVAKSYHLEKEM